MRGERNFSFGHTSLGRGVTKKNVPFYKSYGEGVFVNVKKFFKQGQGGLNIKNC